ncbi:MAG: hypothetical protein M5R36_10940 [Deltaproteobacteria bacterium]|nr:hypothetical protein [Deltaproteobacteria bacterium]
MIRATLILAVFAFSTILACGGDDDDSKTGDNDDTGPDEDDGDDETAGNGCRLPGSDFPDDLILANLCPRNDETQMLCCTEWRWKYVGEDEPCYKGIECDSCYIIETSNACAACEIHQIPAAFDDHCA